MIEPSRRQVLGVAAAATAAAVLPASRASAQAQRQRKTFVLVHGGWRGGWCWRPVTDPLEAQGHKCFTPTLTGLGERSHLLAKGIGLKTHTTDVVNVFKFERLENVVLVGHSVAGMVITAVADQVRDKISSIVFLDAFLPKVGEAANSTASQASRDAQAAALAKGELATPPFPAKAFGGGNEEIWAWIDSLCTPHPLQTLLDPCESVSGREAIANKVFIRALKYKSASFDMFYERAKADRTWKTFEIDSGHDVMIDKPKELVDLLLRVV